MFDSWLKLQVTFTLNAEMLSCIADGEKLIVETRTQSRMWEFGTSVQIELHER